MSAEQIEPARLPRLGSVEDAIAWIAALPAVPVSETKREHLISLFLD